MEVVLFLDVDGCISPLPHRSPDWGDWEKYDRAGYPTPVPYAPVYLSQKMAAELAALPAERRWLTTWGEHANERIAKLLGWETLFYSDPDSWSDEVWWKLEVIKAFEEVDDRPYIWVDDELGHRLEDVFAALPSPDPGEPYRRMLVSPKSSHGITPYHIEAMRKFIEEKACPS